MMLNEFGKKNHSNLCLLFRMIKNEGGHPKMSAFAKTSL